MRMIPLFVYLARGAQPKQELEDIFELYQPPYLLVNGGAVDRFLYAFTVGNIPSICPGRSLGSKSNISTHKESFLLAPFETSGSEICIWMSCMPIGQSGSHQSCWPFTTTTHSWHTLVMYQLGFHRGTPQVQWQRGNSGRSGSSHKILTFHCSCTSIFSGADCDNLHG